MIYIISLIIILSGSLPAQTNQDFDSVKVFLVKQSWHTGIVLKVDEIDSTYFPEVRLFNKFQYIDSGWGDDEFYRHPDFDIELAFKALFYSTPTTLRIEGFNFDIQRYISLSDKGYEFVIERNAFNKLCSFISSTFYKNLSGSPVVIEQRYGGNITFFKALGKYSLFNTCNTWIANGFNTAGYQISNKIVLAEHLFYELEEIKGIKRLK